MSLTSLKLVLIISDGPLMVGLPQQISSRATKHIHIASPPIPSAAIAATVATGVSALVHGIVTYQTIDSDSIAIRETQRSDRRAQAFWDNTDFVVKTLNWPAAKDDSQVRNIQSNNEFEEAIDCIDADILGIVLPVLSKENNSTRKINDLAKQLESFIKRLNDDANILIVHRKTEEDGSIVPLVHPLVATFCVDDQHEIFNRMPPLDLVGGAAYLLSGRSCPIGVKEPSWNFLKPFISDESRQFPLTSDEVEIDWENLADVVVIENKKTERDLLLKRFLYLLYIAFKKENWKRVEEYSSLLIKLRGNDHDYWMHVLSLEQQGKFEELQKSMQDFDSIFSMSDLSAIAHCLVRLDIEKSKGVLEGIDFLKLNVPQSIGAFGRLCFKASLYELGEKAIRYSISRGLAIAADRAQLAKRLYQSENFKDGLRVLRGVGLAGDEITWQELRLKLLVALDYKEDAIRLANKILEQNSTNLIAKSALEKFL